MISNPVHSYLQMTSANPNQFGAPLDQNQYMEQEEEWEREGLLDPAWEKQQRKVRATDRRREDLQSIFFIFHEHTFPAEIGPLATFAQLSRR